MCPAHAACVVPMLNPLNKSTCQCIPLVQPVWSPMLNPLNEEQKAAVRAILRAEHAPMPYLIFGPPGTGKTNTTAEAAIQPCIVTAVPSFVPAHVCFRMFGASPTFETSVIALVLIQRDPSTCVLVCAL
eukprot:1154756-Pelagomonas_calceolata.AAC.6